MIDRQQLYHDFTDVVVQLMYRQQVTPGRSKRGYVVMMHEIIKRYCIHRLNLTKPEQKELCNNLIVISKVDINSRELPSCIHKNCPIMEELAMAGKVRLCRVCGCSDLNCSGCIEKTGEPCHWIEEDLCSACEGKG